MAEKIAAEEEKKRKRAEKFGTGKPASDVKANGDEEPVSRDSAMVEVAGADRQDAKKAKV
jgi:hypothetical protein